MMTGAMFMAQCLQQEGVTKVFGQCGHTNYALIDACHKLGIEYVSFRHEQLAAHAADAYFRVSHKLAVLNVHLSPGMTNAMTGVVTAAADSTPMMVISGNTPSYHHAREPHQGIRFHADASQGDIYRPFCKRVWRDRRREVPGGRDAARAERGADRPSRRGAARRPDGRLLAADRADRSPWPGGRTSRRGGGRPGGVAAARDLLAAARRPLIFVGNGAALSEAWAGTASQVAELSAIPVATTLMAKGVFPEDHALSLRNDRHLGHRVGERNGAAPTSCWRSARRSAKRTAARGTRSTPSRFRRPADPDRHRSRRRSARSIRWTSASSATRGRHCGSWRTRCARGPRRPALPSAGDLAIAQARRGAPSSPRARMRRGKPIHPARLLRRDRERRAR